VIPALIRKFCTAKKRGSPEVILWGDGIPTRGFLYVDDAARGIVLAAENYSKADPVNLGTGSEISIKTLAELAAKLMRFEGRITWDPTKPNGQPRRRLDTSRVKTEFGFVAEIPLEEGLRHTIEWYETNLTKNEEVLS
jgi:GDP-L-fucose synthase